MEGIYTTQQTLLLLYYLMQHIPVYVIYIEQLQSACLIINKDLNKYIFKKLFNNKIRQVAMRR